MKICSTYHAVGDIHIIKIVAFVALITGAPSNTDDYCYKQADPKIFYSRLEASMASQSGAGNDDDYTSHCHHRSSTRSMIPLSVIATTCSGRIAGQGPTHP